MPDISGGHASAMHEARETVRTEALADVLRTNAWLAAISEVHADELSAEEVAGTPG